MHIDVTIDVGHGLVLPSDDVCDMWCMCGACMVRDKHSSLALSALK